MSDKTKMLFASLTESCIDKLNKIENQLAVNSENILEPDEGNVKNLEQVEKHLNHICKIVGIGEGQGEDISLWRFRFLDEG